MRLIFVLSLFLIFPVSSFAEQLCGIGENACETPMGIYNIELPKDVSPNDKIPALLFFHGAGGNGRAVLKNRKMVDTFLNRGFAVIAPTGLKRPNSRWGPMWSFHPGRKKQRDEMAFTSEVLDDAAMRFNIDRDNILMSGFSIGGSLVWYLACQNPDIAKAFAPVSGAFWRPHPKASDCAGPVKLLHTHGWRDDVVPLEGRVLGNGRIEQGDVFYSLQILRQLNKCNNYKADAYDTKGNYWRRWWLKCEKGSALQLNMFDGGHVVPKDWAREAIDWFENLDEAE